MKKNTQILGLISSILFFTGCFFKIMHWPGAGIIITVSVLLFIFAYFLLFTLEKNKLQEIKAIKIINLLAFVFAAFIGLGFLFKIMHWPGAGVLFYIGHFSLLLIIILQFIAISKISDQFTKSRWLNTTYFLIVFLGFSIFMAFRQAPKNEFKTVVAADKMNVLYAGIENPVSIAVSNVSPDRVLVNINKGMIKSIEKGKYIVKIPVDSIPKDNIARIVVFCPPVAEESAMIHEAQFRIKRVPQPEPYFGEYSSGDITLDGLKSTDKITAKLKSFNFEGIEYSVTKFRLIFVPQKGEAHMIETSGDSLSSKMKEILNLANPEDMVIFSSIEVSNPDLGTFKLEKGITLSVK